MRHGPETFKIAARLSLVGNDQELDTIQRLRNIAAKLHRLYEVECNGTDVHHDHEARFVRSIGGWEKYDSYRRDVLERTEKQIEELQEKAFKLAASIGVHIYHQTDPRGRSIYIAAKDAVDKLTSQNYSSFDCL